MDVDACRKMVDEQQMGRLLLVSLANGMLVALDGQNGETLWTIDTGSPLLASTAKTGGGTSDGDVEEHHKEGIFPGTDGSLYTYSIRGEGEAPDVKKLPVTVEDLVQSSPSPTPKGSMVLGSQQSTVFMIDIARGIVLKTIKGQDNDLYQYLTSKPKKASDGINERDDRTVSPTIAISRKDYIIRSIHPLLGEEWNVTWSQVNRMPFLEIHGYGVQGEEDGQQMRLIVAPDFSLKRFDGDTGSEMWSKQFTVPAITAYPANGKPIDMLKATKDILELAMVKKNGDNCLANVRGGDVDIVETLMVGEMNGGLFGVQTPTFCSHS